MTPSRTELALEALRINIVHRRGNRAWALCPFHTDHDPSWFIRLSGSRSGQSHCFSCKEGGTLLELVQHVKRCDAEKAAKFLENVDEAFEIPRGNIRLVSRAPVIGKLRFRMPKEVIFEPFEQWGSVPSEYASERGLTAEEIETYHLGYAADGRLAGRLVIPWIDQRGVVGGYSARSMVGQEPRYLTPKSETNADTSIIVGERWWVERKVIALTEGALNAFGVRRVFPTLNIGALGDSDVDVLQIGKLATFSHVLILTDPDAAGNKAATKYERLLKRYTKTHRVEFPEGQDVLDVGPEYVRESVGLVLRNL